MRKAVLYLGNWSAEDINNLPDMQVDGKVWLPYLYNNQEIKRIPIIGLKVGGELNLTGCESLKSLPEGLSVKGGLLLDHCKLLKSLPEKLKVGGLLYLYGCESLTSLPEGLEVGGSLGLHGCESLISLPQDLQVKGNIFYNSETGFAKIDGWRDDPKIIPPHLRGKFRKFRKFRKLR